MRTLEIGEKRRISNESPGEYEIVRMNLVGPPNPTRRGDFRNKAYSIELALKMAKEGIGEVTVSPSVARPS